MVRPLRRPRRRATLPRREAPPTRRSRSCRRRCPSSPFPSRRRRTPSRSSESVSSLRIDTPITAIETPHPSRVSRGSRGHGGPSTNAAAMIDARRARRPPPDRRRATRDARGAARAGGSRGGRPRPAARANVPCGRRRDRVRGHRAGRAPRRSCASTARTPSAPSSGPRSPRRSCSSAPARKTSCAAAPRPTRCSSRRATATAVVESIEVFAHGSSTAFEDLRAGALRHRHVVAAHPRRRAREARAARRPRLGRERARDRARRDRRHREPGEPGLGAHEGADRATSSPASVRDWSDVGGETGPIALYARDDRSGTYDTFKNLVLAGARRSRADAKRFESSEELSDAVAADAGAIGFIGLPYVRSAKAVMVQDAGSVPLLPSPMTVSTEDYPARPPPLSVRAARRAPLAARELRRLRSVRRGPEGRCRAPASSTCARSAIRTRRAARAARASTGKPCAAACRLSVDFRFDAKDRQLDTRGPARPAAHRHADGARRERRSLDRAARLLRRQGRARGRRGALAGARRRRGARSSARGGCTSTWCAGSARRCPWPTTRPRTAASAIGASRSGFARNRRRAARSRSSIPGARP